MLHLSEKKEKKDQETQVGTIVIHAKNKEDWFSCCCLLLMPKNGVGTFKKSSAITEVFVIGWRSSSLSSSPVIPWEKVVKKSQIYLYCLQVIFKKICLYALIYWFILVYCYFLAFLFITSVNFWRIFWTPRNN